MGGIGFAHWPILVGLSGHQARGDVDYTFGEEVPSGRGAGEASRHAAVPAEVSDARVCAGGSPGGQENEKRGSGRGLAFLGLLRLSSVDEKRLCQIATSCIPAYTRRYLVATNRLCTFHYREMNAEVMAL
jgi:hypothetical protein